MLLTEWLVVGFVLDLLASLLTCGLPLQHVDSRHQSPQTISILSSNASLFLHSTAEHFCLVGESFSCTGVVIYASTGQSVISNLDDDFPELVQKVNPKLIWFGLSVVWVRLIRGIV